MRHPVYTPLHAWSYLLNFPFVLYHSIISLSTSAPAPPFHVLASVESPCVFKILPLSRPRSRLFQVSPTLTAHPTPWEHLSIPPLAYLASHDECHVATYPPVILPTAPISASITTSLSAVQWRAREKFDPCRGHTPISFWRANSRATYDAICTPSPGLLTYISCSFQYIFAQSNLLSFLRFWFTPTYMSIIQYIYSNIYNEESAPQFQIRHRDVHPQLDTPFNPFLLNSISIG